MANTEIKSTINLDMKIILELSIDEAKALNEITQSCNTQDFLDIYYGHIGKSYLKPYENGVISLFETLRNNLPNRLNTVDEIIESVNSIEKDIIKYGTEK